MRKEVRDMEREPWEIDFPISRMLLAKAVRGAVPLSGTFELTSRCNFSCRMCYVHNMQNSGELKKRELTAAQWLEIAEEAKRCGTLFLLLTGGEAMLREDFAEIYCKLSVMGFRIVVNSNGSMLTDEILGCFRKYPPGRVNVSVYGASDETYRDLCGVEARARVTENIRKLKAAGISVRTIMTATPYNCHDMEEICRFSREEDTLLEVGTYMFPPIRLNGEDCGENAGRFTAEDAGRYRIRWERLRCTEEEFHKRAEGKIRECRHLEEQYRGRTAAEGEPVWCQAGRSAYWITWNGKMRPCGLMTRPEGDVLEMGFEQAWRQIHGETAKIRLPRECAVCANRKICRVCAAMCLSETGSFDTRPDYVCRMVDEMKRGYMEETEEKCDPYQ